jgi:UDP-glucose 4-epimerase
MINKVLITGVAGFIGSNLLDFLIEETDWMIYGVDNLSTGNRKNVEHHLGNKRFSFLEAKCSDLNSLKSYDCIFHLAALPRIQPSFEYVNEHITANLNESICLLELMIRDNHFPKFIYSSSSAIYGTPQKIPTDETERVDCLSPYAFQKYEVEKYLELLSTRYPLNFVGLRYFNPYGPRSFNPQNKFNAYSSVVGIFLYKKKQGEALLVTGDGSQKRDFIHVKDLARANYLAAISKEGTNTFFNLGKGNTISILELANKISDRIEFIPRRDGEADVTFADISKAGEMLNWQPRFELDQYIREELYEK